MPRQIVERRAAVFIEMRDGSFGGAFQPSRPSSIVERDRRAQRLDAMVNLRRRDRESITRQPRTGPQHRTGELEDVRIT